MNFFCVRNGLYYTCRTYPIPRTQKKWLNQAISLVPGPTRTDASLGIISPPIRSGPSFPRSITCPCEPRRPPAVKQAVPYGARSDTRTLSRSSSEPRSPQNRSVPKYDTRLDVYFQAKTTLAPLGHNRYTPQAKEAAAHTDDVARAWTSTGRRDARPPDSPFVHPGPHTHGGIRGRNAPASFRHSALNPNFPTNSK